MYKPAVYHTYSYDRCCYYKAGKSNNNKKPSCNKP